MSELTEKEHQRSAAIIGQVQLREGQLILASREANDLIFSLSCSHMKSPLNVRTASSLIDLLLARMPLRSGGKCDWQDWEGLLFLGWAFLKNWGEAIKYKINQFKVIKRFVAF